MKVSPTGWREWSPDQKLAAALFEGPQRHTCLVGGSRSAKTTMIVNAILVRASFAPGSRHAVLRQHGNAARSSISLDTLPKVVRMKFPEIDGKVQEYRQDGFFELPNESQIWVGGLDEKDRVDKILGKEYATTFLNECSQIPYDTVLTVLTRLAQVCKLADGRTMKQCAYYDLNPIGKRHWTNVMFGEKLDPASRDRRPLPDPENYARAFLNPDANAENLTPEYIRSLGNLPSRRRKRFYLGEYIDEIDSALWTYETLESSRIYADEAIKDEVERAERAFPTDKRRRVVVAIDPSGAAKPDDSGRDEIGIVVAALGTDGHGYVLADRSMRDSPAVWGRAAVKAYHDFGADSIVAEQNFGGEMVRFVIQAADANVPVRVITASRGKAVRAEPVSGLYEKTPQRGSVVHHVGRFDTLEDQLCAFTSAGYSGEGSPDHADACIAEGSLVKTDAGDVPIENVRVGDQVLTRAGYRRVVAVRQTSSSAQVARLVTDRGDLVATPDHRVWVDRRGFVRLDAVVCGNNLLTCVRSFARACVLGLIVEKERRPVYDLTVDGEHEFFADGFLVHNCVWALTDLMLGNDAEAWISYYGKLAAAAHAEVEAEKPARPGSVQPKVEEDPDNTVLAAYRRITNAAANAKTTCPWCDEEVGASRVTDGVDAYHDGCYQAMIKAGRRAVVGAKEDAQ